VLVVYSSITLIYLAFFKLTNTNNTTMLCLSKQLFNNLLFSTSLLLVVILLISTFTILVIGSTINITTLNLLTIKVAAYLRSLTTVTN
jgi:hypothetical protein